MASPTRIIVSANTSGVNVGTVGGVEEATLLQSQSGIPQGGQYFVDIKKFAAGDHADGVIRFTGLSSIPSNATITRAQLGLYCFGSSVIDGGGGGGGGGTGTLPRKAEFDANLISSDCRLAGAAYWAYGDSACQPIFRQNWPPDASGGWPGWANWQPNFFWTAGNRQLWAGDLIDTEYYYDSGRVFYGIADYTGNSQWSTIAGRAVQICYDIYAQFSDPNRFAQEPPRMAVPAYYQLPWGAYLDAQRNPDSAARAASKRVCFALANNFAFGDQTSAWTTLTELTWAREAAYSVTTKYLALKLGYQQTYGALWGLTDDALIGLLYLYITQAINILDGGDGGPDRDGNPIAPAHRYVRPFMMGNIAEALMLHFEATGDVRVVPQLRALFDRLWNVCYRANGNLLNNTLPLNGNNNANVPGPGAGGPAPVSDYHYGINGFTYTHANPGPGVSESEWGGDAWDPNQWTWWYFQPNPYWAPPTFSATYAVPELNGLILNVYWWLYQQTGLTSYRDKADLLFDGLVRVSNFYGGATPAYGSEVAQPWVNNGKVFNQMYSRIWGYVIGSLGTSPAPPAFSQTLTLKRSLKPWTQSGVTWDTYAAGVNWATAGGEADGSDRASTVSGQFQNVTGVVGWITAESAGLAADVQAWVSGSASNNGWQLERTDGADDSSYLNVYATENADATTRPYLLVEYTVPAAPSNVWTSVKSGSWQDPTVWDHGDGTVPGINNRAVIAAGHVVTLNGPVTIGEAPADHGAVLEISPNARIELNGWTLVAQGVVTCTETAPFGQVRIHGSAGSQLRISDPNARVYYLDLNGSRVQLDGTAGNPCIFGAI